MTQSSTAKTMNDLMNGELRAAHLYWQAGGWCVERHMEGCSQLLLTHADEELTHMRKMMGYLIDSDLPIAFQELPAPKIDANNVKELFEVILGHEKLVTQRINAAVKEAQENDDLSTFEFLQWFVMEQREEIKMFQGIIDRINLIGDGPHALYHIDREMSELAAASGAGSGGSGNGQAAV
ncbi:MAG: ferritin [Pseudomonadota bacterium]